MGVCRWLVDEYLCLEVCTTPVPIYFELINYVSLEQQYALLYLKKSGHNSGWHFQGDVPNVSSHSFLMTGASGRHLILRINSETPCLKSSGRLSTRIWYRVA